MRARGGRSSTPTPFPRLTNPPRPNSHSRLRQKSRVPVYPRLQSPRSNHRQKEEPRRRREERLRPRYLPPIRRRAKLPPPRRPDRNRRKNKPNGRRRRRNRRLRSHRIRPRRNQQTSHVHNLKPSSLPRFRNLKGFRSIKRVSGGGYWEFGIEVNVI